MIAQAQSPGSPGGDFAASDGYLALSTQALDLYGHLFHLYPCGTGCGATTAVSEGDAV